MEGGDKEMSLEIVLELYECGTCGHSFQKEFEKDFWECPECKIEYVKIKGIWCHGKNFNPFGKIVEVL